MKLSEYSRHKLMTTFAHWDVPKDFADPMYNYLVHGYSPGSCFTAVLANDFLRAVASSHPGNTITAFKALAGWMRDTMPKESYGSYEAVKNWYAITADERRVILEQHHLVFEPKIETWLAIRGEAIIEPVLY